MNTEIQKFIKNRRIYGNLILNDVPVDGNDNVIVKKEKERSDKKVQRSYYNAAFISLDRPDTGRVVTLWQSHTSEGQAVVWKNALNPAIAKRMKDAGTPVAGYILQLDLTEPYQIGENLVEKMSLYVPNEDAEDEVIENAFINAGFIEKTASVGA